MVDGSDVKVSLYKRAEHEFIELVVLTLYLYIAIGGVIMIKTTALHSHGVDFAPWGLAIVKAILLAKFILIGNAMKIGKYKTIGPLVWPTLRRSLATLMFLIILTIVEEVVVGLIHHRSAIVSLGDLFGSHLEETMAGIFMLLLVLVPYISFRVLDEALGEGVLVKMFFVNGRLS